MKKFKTSLLGLISLFLLASCSNSDDNGNDQSQQPGDPALLTIELKGDETATRAVGAPTPANESKIGKGMILVFRSGVTNPIIDGTAIFDFTAASTPVNVNITAGTRDVYVVANINPTDFANVARLSDLYNLTNKYNITSMRSGTNLAMSGLTVGVDATSATMAAPVAVSVALNFIGSRVSIACDLSQLPPVMQGGAFTITDAYLLNVKSGSDYFAPAATSLAKNVNSFLYGAPSLTGFSGSYLPLSPATNTMDVEFRLDSPSTNLGFANNYFYILENATISPTMVCIVGTFDSNTYYYPIVINGSQNGSGTGNATNNGNGTASVARGNQYNVNAIIKGLGSSDPFAPVSQGALSITITTATWAPAIQIDQIFN